MSGLREGAATLDPMEAPWDRRNSGCRVHGASRRWVPTWVLVRSDSGVAPARLCQAAWAGEFQVRCVPNRRLACRSSAETQASLRFSPSSIRNRPALVVVVLFEPPDLTRHVSDRRTRAHPSEATCGQTLVAAHRRGSCPTRIRSGSTQQRGCRAKPGARGSSGGAVRAALDGDGRVPREPPQPRRRSGRSR